MNPVSVVWNWLKTHPRARCAILCVIVFVVGFGSAFYAKPAKVVEKTKTVTQVQTQIQYKDRIVDHTIYVQAEKTHKHTETTTTKHPDGSETTTTKTDENTDENTSSNSTQDAQHQQNTTQVVTQVVEKEKLVLKQPDWRVYAGVGYQFATLGGAPETGIPGMKGLVVQAGADRRIAGPIFLGVSLNTQYTAFINVSGAL